MCVMVTNWYATVRLSQEAAPDFWRQHYMTSRDCSTAYEVFLSFPKVCPLPAAPCGVLGKHSQAFQQGLSRVCFTSSPAPAGTHGNAGQANYATGKAGVIGLTKTVAKVSRLTWDQGQATRSLLASYQHSAF
eukprot:486696-Pelagomonas_calceolata.AAC.1